MTLAASARPSRRTRRGWCGCRDLSVEASAGPGAHVDAELPIGSYGFDERWLRFVCRPKPHDLSIIRVSGDSMAPTLANGDDILVDRSNIGTSCATVSMSCAATMR
jgi:hypothetical protein